MDTYIVGLTGGIASGKTTVSDKFAALGVTIIDADLVAREVVEPGQQAYQKITEHFGYKVINQDKTLNRAWLRQFVFAHPEEKQWLNALLHPIIRERMLTLCEQATSDYCILSVPLLFENKMQAMVQRILVVDVDEQTQLQRGLARDQSSPETIKQIIASQIDRQSRLAGADDVIDNSGDRTVIDSRINALHNKYKQLSKNYKNKR